MAALSEQDPITKHGDSQKLLLAKDAADASPVLLAANGDLETELSTIKSDHDLSLWAYDVQDELLEASLDDYKYEQLVAEKYRGRLRNTQTVS